MEPIVSSSSLFLLPSSSSSYSSSPSLPRGRSVSMTSHRESSSATNDEEIIQEEQEALIISVKKEQKSGNDDGNGRNSEKGDNMNPNNGVVSDSETDTMKDNDCPTPSSTLSSALPRSLSVRSSRRTKSRRVSDFSEESFMVNSPMDQKNDMSTTNKSTNRRRRSNNATSENAGTPSKKVKRKTRRASNASKGSNSNNNSTVHRVKHYVEHNYHDHKYDPIAVPGSSTVPLVSPSSPANTSKSHHHHHKGGVSTPFPERLHQLLEAADDEDLNHIVGWQPHGRCFIVHKPAEFVESVMPRFFKQSKLTSFQRQLNLYGFCRLTTGSDRGGYYHELFIRGRVDLCNHMVRTRVKGNGSKAASSPSTEPNFYKMERCERSDDVTFLQPEEETASMISPVVSAEDLVIEASDLVPAPEPEDETSAMDGRVETPPPFIPMPTLPSNNDLNITLSEGTPMMLDDTFTALNRTPFDDVNRTGSFMDLVTACQPPPLVTPQSSTPKTLFNDSKFQIGCPPILDPMDDSFFTLQDGFHSGDQMYFEGLPFHYLESKDVEESLHHS